MDKETLRQEIRQLVDEVKSTSDLKAFKELLEQKLKGKGDFWDELTDEQKVSVKRSMEQLKRGEGIPDEVIQKEIKSRYKL